MQRVWGGDLTADTDCVANDNFCSYLNFGPCVRCCNFVLRHCNWSNVLCLAFPEICQTLSNSRFDSGRERDFDFVGLSCRHPRRPCERVSRIPPCPQGPTVARVSAEGPSRRLFRMTSGSVPGRRGTRFRWAPSSFRSFTVDGHTSAETHLKIDRHSWQYVRDWAPRNHAAYFLLLTFLPFLIHNDLNAFELSVDGIKESILIDLKMTDFLQNWYHVIDEPFIQDDVLRYLNESKLLNSVSESISPLVFDSSMDFILTKRADDPLNSFQTLRRLTIDVTRLKLLLGKYEEFQSFVNNLFSPMDATLSGDVKYSVLSLIRLQKSYMLLPKQLVQGELLQIRSLVRLTVTDCLLIAQIARQNKFYDFYLMWTEEAHNMCQKLTSCSAGKDVTETLLLLAITEHDEKREKYLQNIEEGRSHANDNIKFFWTKSYLKSKNNSLHLRSVDTDWIQVTEEDRLCNGQSLMTNKEKSKLTCFYLWRKSDPSLILHRFRVEQQSSAPKVLQIHDFISEEMATIIKEIAHPHLFASRLASGASRDGDIDLTGRHSYQAWIHDLNNLRIAQLSKKIGRITGLNLVGAEPLQVVNYGTGGHYSAHYDFFNVSSEIGVFADINKWGDRIATFIIYLNNVEQGGYTVFPRAQTIVVPKMRSAIFWYNLDDACNVDALTLHGGCPVLYGEKWIASKWFRQNGQSCPAKAPNNIN